MRYKMKITFEIEEIDYDITDMDLPKVEPAKFG